VDSYVHDFLRWRRRGGRGGYSGRGQGRPRRRCVRNLGRGLNRGRDVPGFGHGRYRFGGLR
jgi:hypothetical protein